ncbi:hypothetical protein VTK73DRAFT_8418 [Phialemonium thermophilum]|uniref:Uncharacterized protein n=1 Tax=Phialemonium thermophilum TaxID=223376 RepID=A0ABR3W8P3_9PEZI
MSQLKPKEERAGDGMSSEVGAARSEHALPKDDGAAAAAVSKQDERGSASTDSRGHLADVEDNSRYSTNSPALSSTRKRGRKRRRSGEAVPPLKKPRNSQAYDARATAQKQESKGERPSRGNSCLCPGTTRGTPKVSETPFQTGKASKRGKSRRANCGEPHRKPVRVHRLKPPEEAGDGVYVWDLTTWA